MKFPVDDYSKVKYGAGSIACGVLAIGGGAVGYVCIGAGVAAASALPIIGAVVGVALIVFGLFMVYQAKQRQKLPDLIGRAVEIPVQNPNEKKINNQSPEPSFLPMGIMGFTAALGIYALAKLYWGNFFSEAPSSISPLISSNGVLSSSVNGKSFHTPLLSFSQSDLGALAHSLAIHPKIDLTHPEMQQPRVLETVNSLLSLLRLPQSFWSRGSLENAQNSIHSREAQLAILADIPRASSLLIFDGYHNSPSLNDHSSAIVLQYHSPRGPSNLDRFETVKNQESVRSQYNAETSYSKSCAVVRQKQNVKTPYHTGISTERKSVNSSLDLNGQLSERLVLPGPSKTHRFWGGQDRVKRAIWEVAKGNFLPLSGAEKCEAFDAVPATPRRGAGMSRTEVHLPPLRREFFKDRIFVKLPVQNNSAASTPFQNLTTISHPQQKDLQSQLSSLESPKNHSLVQFPSIGITVATGVLALGGSMIYLLGVLWKFVGKRSGSLKRGVNQAPFDAPPKNNPPFSRPDQPAFSPPFFYGDKEEALIPVMASGRHATENSLIREPLRTMPLRGNSHRNEDDRYELREVVISKESSNERKVARPNEIARSQEDVWVEISLNDDTDSAQHIAVEIEQAEEDSEVLEVRVDSPPYDEENPQPAEYDLHRLDSERVLSRVMGFFYRWVSKSTQRLGSQKSLPLTTIYRV